MKKKGVKNIFVSITAWFLAVIGLLLCGIGIADGVTDNAVRIIPSYQKRDLSAVLKKAEWSKEDIDLLYHQTGLSETALMSLSDKREKIPLFQENFFYQGTIVHEPAAFTSPHDYYEDHVAEIAPLEEGDVLVTSSCHTFGWRNGHAAIVVDAKRGVVVESNSPGADSSYGPVMWFREAPNFILLRLKNVSKEERAAIARYAEENLLLVPYSLTVGIFTPKDLKENVTSTNCSHLVWQAYNHFGYDIDSDGGAICTSKDIANYEGFEVVQVYGFDADKLWK